MKRHIWLAAALFAVFSALYLGTPTGNYTFDAVSYAGMIRLADQAGPPSLFHPHHLLFNVVGWVAWRLVRLLSPTSDPLRALQTMNALAGAAGLAVLFLVLRHLLIDTAPDEADTRGVNGVAAAAAAAVGVTFGWWVASTDGRANIPPMAALLAGFYFAHRTARTASGWSAAGLGASLALAVLLHQSHVLFALVAAAAILLAPARAWGKLKLAGAFVSALVPIVLVPYALAAWLHGASDTPAALGWALTYARSAVWWSFDLPANLGRDFAAVRHAFLAAAPGSTAALPLAALTSSYGLLMFSSALVALGVLDRAVGAVRRKQRGHLMPELEGVKGGSVGGEVRPPDPLPVFNVLAGVWIAAYAAFFTVWNPGYFVFWIPVATAWVMLLAVDASAWTERRFVIWTGTAAALCFMVTNFGLYILPKMPEESNRNVLVARQVGASTPRNSVIVVAGMGYLAQMEVYIPYFGGRETVSVHESMSRYGRAGVAQLAARIKRKLSAGGQVYVFGEVFRPGPAWRQLEKRYGLRREMLNQVLTSFRPAEAFRVPGQTVYRLAAGP